MSHFAGVHFAGVHFSPVQFDTMQPVRADLALTSESVLVMDARVLGPGELYLTSESQATFDATVIAGAEELALTSVSVVSFDGTKIGKVWNPVPKDESDRWTKVTQDRVDTLSEEEA